MKIFIALSALVACGLAVEEAKVIAAPVGYAGYPYAGYPYAGYPYAGYPYAAPVAAPLAAPVAAAPVAAAPVAAYAGYPYAAPYAAPYNTGSQFHAQDEFGNLNYGYTNLNSAKQEVGNTYGGVTGGYSYVDANGELQQVRYVADGLGFRVEDSRLPVAPVYDGVAPTFNPEALVAPTYNPVLPVAPEVTPEVAEATAAHLAAVAAIKAESAERKKREADPAILSGSTKILTPPTPFIHNAPALPYAGLPYGAGLGYAGLNYGAGLGYAGLPYGAGLGYAGYGAGYGAGYAGHAGLPYYG